MSYSLIRILREKGGLGDVVRIFPVLDGLRKRSNPGTKIHYYGPGIYRLLVCTHCKAATDAYSPFVYTETDTWKSDDLGRFRNDMANNGNDLFADLNCPAMRHVRATNGRPTKDRVELFCEEAGVPPSSPKVVPTRQELADRNALHSIIASDAKKLILLAGHANGSLRALPEEKASQLQSALHSNGRQVHRVGHTKLEWHILIAWLLTADLVVAVDTGIFHLAAALGVKTLGLFGPTDGALISKWYPTASVMQAENKVGCKAPCYWYNDNGFGGAACNRHCYNLVNLDVDAVVSMVKELLQ